MSRWETLSFKQRGTTDSISRFTSGDKTATEEVMVGSKGTVFDGETCWLSHDVTDGYIIRMSDTTDMGSIRRLWEDEIYSVMRHDGSLYTYEVQGHSIVPKTDKLAQLPDWVQVGGNWGHMDQ